MNAEVSLREVAESDLRIFFDHQLDPVATEMAGFPSRDWPTFETHWKLKVLPIPSNVTRTILWRDAVAGNIGSWPMHGARFVGYWIGRDFWNRGIATAALSLFLQIVTDRPLSACVVKHNLASRRVLERCGFQLRTTRDDELEYELSVISPSS